MADIDESRSDCPLEARIGGIGSGSLSCWPWFHSLRCRPSPHTWDGTTRHSKVVRPPDLNRQRETSHAFILVKLSSLATEQNPTLWRPVSWTTDRRGWSRDRLRCVSV